MVKMRKKFAFLLICNTALSAFLGYSLGYSSRKTEQVIIENPVEVIKYIEVEEHEQPIKKSLGVFDLSAYCNCSKCCGQYANGITASGTKATAGRTIAVDPSIIQYGTKVIINGHTYVAEDCGGSVKGNKIDIFFDTHSEALHFGRQKAEVFVSE